jgi:hypothetical protein
MTEYNIERFDVAIFGNSITKVPLIYIKPDLELLEFAIKNHNVVECEINNTGTIYDGKKIPGVIYTSSNIPSRRPNFFKDTGFYVVSLWSNWYGYPDHGSNGKIKFAGTNIL